MGVNRKEEFIGPADNMTGFGDGDEQFWYVQTLFGVLWRD